jgi:hypothetical protein
MAISHAIEKIDTKNVAATQTVKGLRILLLFVGSSMFVRLCLCDFCLCDLTSDLAKTRVCAGLFFAQT